MIDHNDLRNILRHRVEAAGSQRKWAVANGVSDAYVCDLLNGKRTISEEIAKKLGYERKVLFYPCATSDIVK